jgi:hypothetical protein
MLPEDQKQKLKQKNSDISKSMDPTCLRLQCSFHKDMLDHMDELKKQFIIEEANFHDGSNINLR